MNTISQNDMEFELSNRNSIMIQVQPLWCSGWIFLPLSRNLGWIAMRIIPEELHNNESCESPIITSFLKSLGEQFDSDTIRINSVLYDDILIYCADQFNFHLKYDSFSTSFIKQNDFLYEFVISSGGDTSCDSPESNVINSVDDWLSKDQYSWVNLTSLLHNCFSISRFEYNQYAKSKQIEYITKMNIDQNVKNYRNI